MIQFAVLLVIVLILIGVFKKTPVTIQKPWQHFFDNVQFSTVDFYHQVESAIQEREMPAVNVQQETLQESHAFSDLRSYLRISHREYVFYVCAAPFGTGTFVSWWLCVKEEGLLNKIPLLNKLLGKDRKNKTFYQRDTEAMYKGMIHSILLASIDNLTSTQGTRGFTDLQRQYSYN